MTSPYALLLSIGGTVFGFIIALVGIVADATTAPTLADSDAVAHSVVSAIAQDVRHVDPVAYTVALVPAASGPQARGR